MDLMRERTSYAYKVQAEMMIEKVAPQFNQVPSLYNIMQQQYNIVQPHYNHMQYNQAPQYNARRGDRVGYRGGRRGRGGF
jgi:hypothetical protein